jgi:imidazoleglycerol-phosphate dehydratase
MSSLVRETRETRVELLLELRRAADATERIATGDPFLDHMLVTLARYADLHLAVEARGDLRHHLVEDVAIALGQALRAELPAACARYGAALVPMDDALVQVALDLGGRAWYEGPLPAPLWDHFLRSLAENAAATLHVQVVRGRDRHHVVEAAIKALGLALRAALVPAAAPFSTKGSVRLEWTGSELDEEEV